MPKKIYDYTRLKQEYFESDIDEVRVFFESKMSRFHGRISEKTRGRREEKQRWKEEEFEKELRKNHKSTTQKIKVLKENILVGKSNIVKYLNERALEIISDNKQISSKGLKMSNNDRDRIRSNNNELFSILKLLKTELGEPNNISKQENVESHEEQKLTQEDEEILAKISKRAGK